MTSFEELKQINPEIEVVKKFPKSGQKSVYLVKHKRFGEVIAKIVNKGNLRVEREIDIIKNNSLENVPKILEIKEFTDKTGELNMCLFEEYIEGETLRDRISHKELSLNEGIHLLKTLIDIVVILEEKKIVHRDIKPDNIICTPEGEFYLIDFGIARQLNRTSLTFTDAPVGPHTPGYGAPELFQYSKRDIDSRADLFSIGVVLYEALTGEHPFITGDEANNNDVWYKTKTKIPKEVVIDGDKDKHFILYILTLMQKHITRRPMTAQKAKEWLVAVMDTLKEG